MDFFADAKRVYDRLSDNQSRDLYRDLVTYNLTKDSRFFNENVANKLIDFGFSLEEECNKYPDRKVIIFGAGVWGRTLRNIYSNVRFHAFIDNNKSGNSIDDLPVYTPRYVAENIPNAYIVVSVNSGGDEIKQQLQSLGIAEENIFFVTEKLAKIAWRLEQMQYFDLPYLPHDENEVFVDVGAFDGVSSLNFVKWSNNKYKHIYLFEANTNFYNQTKLKLDGGGVKNYTLIPKGLWSEPTSLIFYESPHDSLYNVVMHEHNCFDAAKEKENAWKAHTIDVTRMDDVIDERVTFIKMDIEGSEANALKGAERTLREYKPKLAISVYHKKDDLWTIPNIILDCNADYKFYLRNYSLGFAESILYAL